MAFPAHPDMLAPRCRFCQQLVPRPTKRGGRQRKYCDWRCQRRYEAQVEDEAPETILRRLEHAEAARKRLRQMTGGR